MNGPHAISMDGKPSWKIMKYTDVWSAKCVFLAKSDTNLYASSVTKGRILEYKLNTGEMLTLRRLEGVKTFLRHRDTLTWGPSLRSSELWRGERGTAADMAASWGWSPQRCLGLEKGISPIRILGPWLRLHLGRGWRGPLRTSSLEVHLQSCISRAPQSGTEQLWPDPWS